MTMETGRDAHTSSGYLEDAASDFPPEQVKSHADSLIVDRDGAPVEYELFENCILKF